MPIKNIRLEVMQSIEHKVEGFMNDFLVPIEKIWQPTDFLPNSQSDTFLDEIEQIREESKELGYDFWVTMVADTITEEGSFFTFTSKVISSFCIGVTVFTSECFVIVGCKSSTDNSKSDLDSVFFTSVLEVIVSEVEFFELLTILSSADFSLLVLIV